MARDKVRQQYQGLPRKELLDKAYELGVNYHHNSSSCSQTTVAALHEILGFDDVVVKVASSLAGGTAIQVLGACGALAGGTMVLDYYFGRPIKNLSDRELIQDNIDKLFAAYDVAILLVNKFVEEYGTFICAQMHRQFFGRIYCGTDPEEMKKFVEAGNVKKADDVVGKASRWVMEILLEKGAIKLQFRCFAKVKTYSLSLDAGGYNAPFLGIDEPLDALEDSNKGWVYAFKKYAHLANLLGICAFHLIDLQVSPSTMAELFSAATGIEKTGDDLMSAADRFITLERAFNAREGFRRIDDETIPHRFTKEPYPEEYAHGQVVKTKPNLDSYYRAAGLDLKTGIPTESKFKQFGLAEVADKLKAEGIPVSP